MEQPLRNEVDLVECARQHDEVAFGELVDFYTTPVYRVVCRMVNDSMEAESIVQETFWRFWQALPRYDAGRPLLPYLAAIASNLARDRYRRQRWVEEAAPDSLLARVPDPHPEPEDGLVRKGTLQRLADAVETLPFPYRSVISLRYEAEMSYQEIAEALSLPLNTVRTHLRRAKQALRERLEETNDG
jgi:RNA polymerase sigma-70 factor (ECF subfamily)